MTSGHYDKKFYETNYPNSKTSAQIALNDDESQRHLILHVAVGLDAVPVSFDHGKGGAASRRVLGAQGGKAERK